MSKTYTVNEVLKEIASTIKTEIAAHEASIEAMRKKELERSHGKLNKSESLCPLCAEVDVKGRCGCLAKSTPPDISEKTMHKLKDEYGHDKGGKEKAYATAWSIENKMKKDEMGPSDDSSMMMSELCLKCGKKNSLCKCMGKKEEHLDKNDFITGAKHTQGYNAKVSFGPKATHRSGTDSMMATSPKDEPAAYGGSVKGSPAHNAMQHLPTKPAPKPINITKGEDKPFAWPKDSKPGDLPGGGNIYEKGKKLDKAAMASSSASALAPKPEVSTPAAHVNKELGGFKSLASKGPSISSMGRQKASVSGSFNTIKAETSPTYAAKTGISTSSKTNAPFRGRTQSLGETPVKMNGSKTPPVIKSELKATETPAFKPNPGSGGETKKGPSLKKSTIPSVKQPAVVGTAGKQPVGLGGGDANKIPGGAPATPNVQGSSPAGQWKGQGLPQLQQKLAAVRGGVSWLKSTHSKASRVHPAQAAPKSQRFHGALPLQRAEVDASPKDQSEKPKETPEAFTASCPRHFVCSPSCSFRSKVKAPKTKKAEMPAPTEGLSSINHNRRMLKVKA